MAFDDIYRIIASRNLAVNSSAGTVTSTAAFGAQTYAVQLCFVAGVASTAGLRFSIGELGNNTPTSTASPLLPPNWVQVYKVTPGQQLAALSNDASAIANLSIVELSK